MCSKLKDILDGKKLFVFDMDGTIYLGDEAFPYAISFINHLREDGKRVLFFTNNASRSSEHYYRRLTDMGFSPHPGEVLTSGDVTLDFLKRSREGKKVYLVGSESLCRQFGAAGIEQNDTDADIVIVSFDPEITYKKLDTACRLINGGAEYLSTHPDMVCPVKGGSVIDSGAFCALVNAVTGKKPVYFGKPYRPAVDGMCALTSVKPEEMCIFGDRMYTDIALGKRNGITSVLVLTGETSREDAEGAQEADRPDFTVDSLDDIDRIMYR